MEAKNVIAFEYVKEDRIYKLEIPYGAPLGEAYEACAAFWEKTVELINEHASNAIKKEEDAKDNEGE